MWGNRVWQYQAKAGPVFTPPPTVGGWFQNASIPVWVKPAVLNATWWTGVLFVPAPIGWQRQSVDPIFPQPQVIQGGGTFVKAPDGAPAQPDFGWFHQSEDPIAARTAPEGGLVRPLVPPAPSFAWFEQGPPPIHARSPVVEGGTVRPLAPPAPRFGWYLPATQPIQPVRFIIEGPHKLAFVPVAPAPDFGWFRQASEPLRIVPPIPQGWSVLVREPPAAPAVPPFSWFNQGPDVLIAQPIVQREFWSQALEPIVPVWTTYGDPYLYEALYHTSTTGIFLECYFRAVAGTAYARVFDVTAGLPVPASVISSVSGTYARIRSANIFPLVDGHEYVVQFGRNPAGDARWVGVPILIRRHF